MSGKGVGQSAQTGRNRAIDINNRPPGVDIETLKQSNPDTNRVLDWFESRLESLQRENAALRDVLDRRGNLSKYVDSGNLLAEQKAAAITPEMRETAEKWLKDYAPGHTVDYIAMALSGRVIIHDLLGKQG